MRRLLVLLLLAGAGAAGWWWWKRPVASDATADPLAESVRTAIAQRRKLVVGLIENGQLQAIRSHNLQIQINQANIKWIIEEGKEVKKGDKLLELDREEFEKRLTDQEEQAKRQQEDFDKATANLPVEKATATTWVADAELASRRAQDALRKYREVDARKTRRDLDEAVNRAQDALAKAEQGQAKAEAQADNSMFATGAVRENLDQQADNARNQIDNARKALEEAIYQKNTFTARTYPQELDNLAREVERTRLAIDQARTRAETHVAQLEKNLVEQRKRLDNLLNQIRKQREMLDKMTLTAPSDGVVIYGDPRNGNEEWIRQQLKVGQRVWQGNTLLTIPDMSGFQISVPIPEHYRGRVEPGTKAFISIPAIPGLSLTGSLTKISTLAAPRDPGNPSSPKVFTGTVELAASDGRMVSGMTAKVELVAEVVEAALCVPIEAVFVDGENRHCLLDGGRRRQAVKTGRMDDHLVEITEGLDEGQRVWLYEADRERQQQEGARPPGVATPAAALGSAGG